VYTFGVSGRLYKSNVLLYDHQTESLWSQLREQAIAGPLAGSQLQSISSYRMSWGAWLKRHPDTRVLSTQTGFDRDYRVDPYWGYYNVGGLMFTVGDVRTDLKTKTRVLGVKTKSGTKAYPLDILAQHNDSVLTDQIGTSVVRIQINGAGEVVDVTDRKGVALQHIFAFWFAWQAFYPETAVYVQ
jgi:hypothetical protein